MIGGGLAASLSHRLEAATSGIRQVASDLEGSRAWTPGQQDDVRSVLEAARSDVASVSDDLSAAGIVSLEDAVGGMATLDRSLGRALAGIDESPRTVASAASDALRQAATGARRLTVVSGTAELAERLRSNPVDAQPQLLETIRRIVDKPAADVTSDDIRLLASIDELPHELRPPMPMPGRPAHPLASQFVAGWVPSGRSFGQVTVSADLHRWRIALEAIELAGDGATTAAGSSRRVHAIVDRPVGEVTPQDLHELAVLDALPGALRPRMPRPMTLPLADLDRESSAAGALTPQARLELRSLQLSVGADRLATDPRLTSASLAAEIEQVVARPDADITTEELRRIAVIERLPAAIRPSFPAPIRGPERSFAREFATIDRGDWHRSIGVRNEVDNLRLLREQRLLAEAPTTTRSAMDAEVADILARTADQLDAADLRRLAILDGLPPHLRPDLPPSSLYDASPMNLAAGDAPGSRDGVRELLRTIQRWQATTSPAGLERLREAIASNGTVYSHTLQHLAASPALAESLGVDAEELLALTMRSMSTDVGSRFLRRDVTVARTALDRLEQPNAMLQRVHDQVRSLLDANVDRFEHRRNDGFSGHADYADIGRAASLTELLVAGRRQARAAEGTSTGAEVLSW